jgi:hypothetical protein
LRPKKVKEEAPSQQEEALAEYKRRQLQLAANDNPEDFPDQKVAERDSFNVVLPASEEFALTWSRREAACEARACAPPRQLRRHPR